MTTFRLFGSWVYGDDGYTLRMRNPSGEVIQSLERRPLPVSPHRILQAQKAGALDRQGKPARVRKYGSFCPFVVELAALGELLEAQGHTVEMVDANQQGAGSIRSRLSTIPAVVAYEDTGELVGIFDVREVSDLQARHYTPAKIQARMDRRDAREAARAARIEAVRVRRHRMGVLLGKQEAGTLAPEELQEMTAHLVRSSLGL